MNAYEIWQSLIFFKESFMLIALILNKKNVAGLTYFLITKQVCVFELI